MNVCGEIIGETGTSIECFGGVMGTIKGPYGEEIQIEEKPGPFDELNKRAKESLYDEFGIEKGNKKALREKLVELFKDEKFRRKIFGRIKLIKKEIEKCKEPTYETMVKLENLYCEAKKLWHIGLYVRRELLKELGSVWSPEKDDMLILLDDPYRNIDHTHPFYLFWSFKPFPIKKMDEKKREENYRRIRSKRDDPNYRMFRILARTHEIVNEKDDLITYLHYLVQNTWKNYYSLKDVELRDDKLINLCNGMYAILEGEEIEMYKKLLKKASKNGWVHFRKVSREGKLIPVLSEKEANFLECLYKAGVVRKNSTFAKQYRPKHLLGDSVAAVINITWNCPLRCKYCYAGGGENTQSLSIYDFLDFIDIIMQGCERVNLIFHGGEPLLEWKKIKNCLSLTHNLCVKYSLQTSGIGLNEEVIKYARFYKIGLGISIDGPKHMHNKTRTYPDGKGTFDDVMQSIELIRKYDLKFGIITVLGKHNFNVNKLLDFYLDNVFTSVKINPLFPMGRGKDSPFAISLKDYYKFMRSFVEKSYQAWVDGELFVKESNFQYILNNFHSVSRPYMCLRYPCGAGRNTLAIDPYGYVYACDDFASAAETRFRGPHVSRVRTLQELLEHPNIAKIRNMSFMCNPWHIGCCKAQKAVGNTLSTEEAFDFFDWLSEFVKENPYIFTLYGVKLK